MSDQRGKSPQELSDELKAAVERTFATVSDSAAGTRGRAQDLLDEAVRRGKDAAGALEGEITALRKRVGELESSLSKRVGPKGRG